MTPSPQQALAYARDPSRRTAFVRGLADFVRFPSVGGQPARAGDVRRCAAWLADHLRGVGLEHVRVVPTAGHPVVYADWLHAPGRPTVLVYGHYDVQPPEPLAAWTSPPFEPAVRGGYLYGRGAADDKGQLFAHVKAIEAYLRTAGRLPVNVRCVFEGEEETGSAHLGPLLRRHRRALAADVAVVSDMSIPGPDRPAVTYSLRGALSVELEVRGPAGDLHSGNYGGAVHNPLQALCEIVAGLHDRRGRIAVEGFYDRVRDWGPAERAFMARNGPGDAEVLANAAAPAAWGEPGFTAYERLTVRPALSVNGIVGGYQGPGAKAVIPSAATAKLNFRLVPDQNPREIEALLRRHVARLTPPTVRSRVTGAVYADPVTVDRGHPAMRAAAAAYRRGFGARPVLLRCGGSIPVVNVFQDALGVPAVLMGFALPGDRLHGPDERFHLPTFFNAIATSTWFLWLLAQADRAAPAAAAGARAAMTAGAAGHNRGLRS